MSSPEDLPDGQCVCGRPLPDDPLSDWACSEPCQSAWLHYHADPDVYPHPREIRAAAEARAAVGRRPTTPVRVERAYPHGDHVHWGAPGELRQIPDGTAIDVDGNRYVRDGGQWRPAGMWTPLRTELAAVVEYRRWCPHCHARRPMVAVNGPPGSELANTQVCASCDHHWQGPPLIGLVETRGAPWPALRLRLTDGQRSAALMFTEEEILTAGADMAARIERCWNRLERQLRGGIADVDQADDRARARAARRVARGWHWPASRAVDIMPDREALGRWMP